ncbi:MAG TPA: HAMP domain-containing methyl-accepting chemotaxis protein [Candidatus Acidoferrales bacterium]|nr:HAMP domain-containing methyl-accepting chemotaxis protein [Candidatus Acidoferrales bacterium]
MFRRISVERRLTYNSIALLLFLALMALVGGLGLGMAWIIAVLVLALVVSVPLTISVSRSITVPIQRVGSAASDLSQGKLSVVLEDQQLHEIGDLHGRFRAIAEYLKEMSELSSAIANGDLTIQAEPRSDDDVLSHAFRHMTEGLSGIVRSVRSAATQVAAGADQVAAASRETEQASSQVSKSIDELASAMAEMSANVKSVSKNTQMQAGSVSQTSQAIEKMASGFLSVATNVMLLCDISDRSREEVRSGMEAAAKANEGLKQINTSISSTAEFVTALSQRAESIGNIVEVIDDIAEQTNLLALNAAIEAARAGEHGLGFAVVADEVRKLAEKSAQSTNEINALIRSIQEETRRAVHNMEQSTTRVSEGMKTGAELTQALERIGNVVMEFNRLAQEVGTATSEQSDVSARIERATSQLNEITQEISSAIQEQADGADSAVKSLERMRGMIQRFSAGTVQLAATAEQMTKMSRLTLDAVGGFSLEDDRARSAPVYRLSVEGRRAHTAVM